jgi:mRNA interferase RelE/StbE
MKVEFLGSFNRDIGKLSQSVKKDVAHAIEAVEQASKLAEIGNLKKLKGFKNVYRIRIGDYRIGLFIEKGTVEFARIVHRKDIYKVFP